MSALARTTRFVPDERGAVGVLVAVILPVLILLSSFVIDIGNWFVHERHLQTQADAGALAGGQEFQFGGACSNTSIEQRAMQYSGTHTAYDGATIVGLLTPYNQLTGNTTSIYENINQQAYPTQPNQPTPDSTTLTGNPCNDEMLDLKLTETPLPWYFKAIGVGGINAHARVSVLQQASGSGFLPIAVNETTPVAARAYFINEDTQAQLASVALTNTGTNAQGQAIWSNVAAPLAVAITTPHVGVIIALSGSTTNTTCPSNSQFVNCFDLSPGPSLVHIQGWSALGTGSFSSPLARSVTLQPASCVDGYFSNAPVDSPANCTFGVNAVVDLGSTPNPPGVTVAAVVAGTSYPLTYTSSSSSWTGSATLPTGTGSNQVDLKVKCDKTVTGSPCSGGKSTSVTISDVQRSYAASSSTSGTIESAVISENGVGDANSFQVCETGNTSCTHNLVATIAVAGSLQNLQQPPYPLYTMRFGTSSASQTGAIACPPGGQGGFRVSLESGCSGEYAINGPPTPDPACVNINPLPGSTPPPPADCVLTDNGVKTGQLRQGLRVRLANQSCPNNFSTYTSTQSLPAGDPRIVEVFITYYGSFGGSGNNTYPIQNFATFYITGWDGDPCSTDDPAALDEIKGHFIHYTNPYAIDGDGTQPCSPTSFGTCFVVLTQ